MSNWPPSTGRLLPGGGDLSPHLYGADGTHKAVYDVDHEQDAFDLEVARQAFALGLPLLAVCRGLQVVNTVRGGTCTRTWAGRAGNTGTSGTRCPSPRLRRRGRHRHRADPGVLLPHHPQHDERVRPRDTTTAVRLVRCADQARPSLLPRAPASGTSVEGRAPRRQACRPSAGRETPPRPAQPNRPPTWRAAPPPPATGRRRGHSLPGRPVRLRPRLILRAPRCASRT